MASHGRRRRDGRPAAQREWQSLEVRATSTGPPGPPGRNRRTKEDLMALATLRYDLRQPDFAKQMLAERYATCLDQCAFAEGRGVGMVVVSEHHDVDDGYLPSPLILAGAIAARTRTMSINIRALLVPLHDPL